MLKGIALTYFNLVFVWHWGAPEGGFKCLKRKWCSLMMMEP